MRKPKSLYLGPVLSSWKKGAKELQMKRTWKILKGAGKNKKESEGTGMN